MRILSPGKRLCVEKIPPLASRGNLLQRMVMLVILSASLMIADSVYSQTPPPANVTITFSGKRVSLKQVFNEIKKQTKYDVLYNPTQVDTTATISVSAKNQPLEEFLKAILSKHSLGYSFINTTIVVYRKEDGTNFTMMPAKGRYLDGAVYDEKSTAPLVGVSVMLLAAGKGTQTNSKGQYMFKDADENDSLRFTIIGYEPVTLALKNAGNTLNVTMKVTTSELDATIVKAFGVTSNRLATGSITRVSGEEIRRQPVMNPLLALQGRVPGMVITPTSGYASSPVKVEIRGRNTLNESFSGEPLYVVDGVPRVVLDVDNSIRFRGPSTGPVQGGISYTGGQSILFGMNPNDIESIEVLRDGDATAMYGTRAANGVVLITTKKAKAGKTVFGINVDQGVSINARNVKMLNTQQYLQMRREAFKNDGIAPTPENAPDLMIWDSTRYTNWQKELLHTGKNLSVGAQLSGGDVRNSIRLSAQYTRNTGMTQLSGKNEAIAISAGINHRSLNQKLKVDLMVNYNWSYVDAINSGGDFTMAPNAPSIFNEKGELNYAEWNAGTVNFNRFDWASNLLRPNIAKTNGLNSSLNVGYEIIEGLQFNTQLAFSNSINSNDAFITIASQNPAGFRMGQAFFSNTKASNWSIKSTLDYSRWIGRGRLGVTAGASYESQSTSAITTFALGYDNDELITSITNAPFTQTGSKEGLYRIASAFGTINYNWENKYILNLNGRRDGSSRFAPDRQFGNFGSVGASWVLSEEEWVKTMMPSWLSFVKLRSSYALTGSDAIGDYQFLSLWSGIDATQTPRYEYNGVRSFVPLQPVNQQYRWEAKKSWEGALWVGFLENRMSIELITYRNIANNSLVQDYPTPVYSGFPTVVTNSRAKIENKGVELSLNAALMQKKNFAWRINFNIAVNKNKLLAYPGLGSSPHATLYKIGYPITSQFMLHYIGIDPLTGLYSFEDHNKDGVIVADVGKNPGMNGDDRYVALNLSPKYAGGFSTEFTICQNFSLNMQFDFKKTMVTDLFATARVGGMNNLYMPEEILNDHWRKPGDHSRYPRFSTQLPVNLNYSDGQYTDGSYLRLNNIQASWQLPEKLISKAGMKGCAFSVAVNNVFVITSYKGADPTIGDLSTPPQPMIINGRLTFMF